MAKGQLVFVGLGLYDAKDLSLKGLDEIQKCDSVFAEFYTATLAGATQDEIEHTIGKKIKVLSREETEQADALLDVASREKVVLLVCGDPLIATTHVDIRLQAHERGIPTKVVHGSSIVTAVPGLLGLQNYKFGRTTTLVFPEKKYFPTSPYAIIRDNKARGLHTLVLLDIQADRNRYMTANEGIDLLLKMEEKHQEQIIGDEHVLCVVARAGSADPLVVANTCSVLGKQEFGSPLHTLVVPGDLHFMEVEALVKLAGLPGGIAGKIQKL